MSDLIPRVSTPPAVPAKTTDSFFNDIAAVLEWLPTLRTEWAACCAAGVAHACAAYGGGLDAVTGSVTATVDTAANHVGVYPIPAVMEGRRFAVGQRVVLFCDDVPVIDDSGVVVTTCTSSAGADDGQIGTAASGEMGYAASGQEMAFGGYPTRYEAFFRFPAIPIPPGARILSAVWRACVPPGYTGAAPNIVLHCQAADDAIAPTTAAQFDALALTSGAAWIGIPSLSAGEWLESPNIAHVVQEVVDRPGWASGNAVMLVIRNYMAEAAAWRGVYSYEKGVEYRPELIVTWAHAGVQIDTARSGVLGEVVTYDGEKGGLTVSLIETIGPGGPGRWSVFAVPRYEVTSGLRDILPVSRERALAIIRDATGVFHTDILPTFNFFAPDLISPAGLTVTRSGLATRRDATGQIVDVADDIPRWQYTRDGRFQGLLIEPRRSNYLPDPTVIADKVVSLPRGTFVVSVETSQSGSGCDVYRYDVVPSVLLGRAGMDSPFVFTLDAAAEVTFRPSGGDISFLQCERTFFRDAEYILQDAFSTSFISQCYPDARNADIVRVDTSDICLNRLGFTLYVSGEIDELNDPGNIRFLISMYESSDPGRNYVRMAAYDAGVYFFIRINNSSKGALASGLINIRCRFHVVSTIKYDAGCVHIAVFCDGRRIWTYQWAVGEMMYGYFSPDILELGGWNGETATGLAGCIYHAAYFPAALSDAAALALSCPSK